MPFDHDETIPIETPEDIVRIRNKVRARAAELGMSSIDQTKLVTAASELARNTLEYGCGGRMRIEAIRAGLRRGLRLTFQDEGPGIPNIEQALADGCTTGSGLGLGLGGARRLSNEFKIESEPGRGTRVTIARWTLAR